MGSINVNTNVYEAVKAATYDGWTTSPQVSNSEQNDIEVAIAADGVVDQGEAQLLQALKNKTDFTVSASGEAPYNVDDSLLSFDNTVTAHRAGTRVAEHSDGYVYSVPSHVPTQTTGRQTNVYDSARTSYSDARAKLLDINNWDECSSTGRSASFQLVGPDGNTRSGTPRVGDYIRIDLPGPSGYDWVQIEDIRDTPNMASITVRPSNDPTSDSDETSHFFTSAATNTFTVERDGNGLTMFHVNGRNEVGNSGVLNTVKDYGGIVGDNLWVMPGQQEQWEWLGEYVLDK
ncbi:MAG: hypothetical protein CVV27_18340 [Candidatus Melainabacteria bacterium HGW-Melainabacteria-1]|nr:MAG: hypothetical protein CVV27_18340 [Candidatus Melainabacteria bacterium HGW-Melainabacteria-1]